MSNLLKVKPKAIKQSLASTIRAGELARGRVADYRTRQRDRSGRQPVRSRGSQIHGAQRVRLRLAVRRPRGCGTGSRGRRSRSPSPTSNLSAGSYSGRLSPSHRMARAATSVFAKFGPGSQLESPCILSNSTLTFPARCQPGFYRHSARPSWVSHEFNHRPPRPSRPVWTGPRSGGRPTCLAFAMSDAHAAAIEPWSRSAASTCSSTPRGVTRSRRHGGDDVLRYARRLNWTGSRSKSAWPYLNAVPADLKFGSRPRKVGQLFRRRLTGSGRASTMPGTRWRSGTPALIGMTISDSLLHAEQGRSGGLGRSG